MGMRGSFMITITTPHGIIELAHIEPDDAFTIKAQCGHGTGFFDRCYQCEPCTHKGADFDTCECKCDACGLMDCQCCVHCNKPECECLASDLDEPNNMDYWLERSTL